MVRHSVGQALRSQFALDAELAGLYDVITRKSKRGKTFAGLLCECLLSLAACDDAENAYLQTKRDDHDARQAYAGLGFADQYSQHYSEHYRQPPTASPQGYSPKPSSMPRCTFMACTAAPLAPLPRLSRRAITMACV